MNRYSNEPANDAARLSPVPEPGPIHAAHPMRRGRPVRAVSPVDRGGLRLKQLVLVFGALYLGMVCLTNLVNLVASVTDSRWVLLNSGNAGYIGSVVHAYGWPAWFDDLAVLGAATMEGVGCALFVRALIRYRGGGRGVVAAYQALAWNLGIWLAFIAGTEFFVAYSAEGPFRELFALGLLMTLVVTVVPDDVRSTPDAVQPAAPTRPVAVHRRRTSPEPPLDRAISPTGSERPESGRACRRVIPHMRVDEPVGLGHGSGRKAR
jgi:hypothetical protein